MAKYCKVYAKVDESGQVEIAGLKVSEEEYNKATKYALQGNISASVRALLNSKQGREVFHLKGTFKSRMEHGKEKLQAWNQDAVKKFLQYYYKEFGINEDIIKKNIKNWRDGQIKKARAERKAENRVEPKK